MGPARNRGNGLEHHLLLLLALAAAADLAVAQQPSSSSQSYFGRAGSFSPSMAIEIVVLITAFFFLGFFSIYIRRCAGDPLGPPSEYRPGRLTGITFTSAARSRRQRGLDPAVVEAFPTMAYADVKAHKAGKGELECAVCLSEFDDDETLRLLPKCSHVFHPDCIDAWLASHVTCPVCRANLVPDAEVAAATAPTTEQDAPAPQQPPVQEVVAAPDQVTVVIVDAEETEEERIRREEAAELVRIGSVKRALRTKSGRRPAQFRRSHTTGHSLASPAAGETADRYTLRLPEHVLREIVSAGKLRRSTSLLPLGAGGEWSARRGFRRGRSVRLGRSGRGPASFLTRTFSAGLPAWGSVRRGEGGKVAGDDQACAAGGRV